MPFSRRVAGSLLVLLSALYAFWQPLEADAQVSYSSVVVFGDSLSDIGNIANLTQSQYKVRFPADNPLLGFDYTDGRFTDGTDTQPAASTAYTGVWIEQVAALFGGKVVLKDSLDGGTDYAYGDATTGAGTTTESKTFAGVTLGITLNNMGQQVTDYLATKPQPNAQTLYVLWGGANDLLGAVEAGQDPVAAAGTAAQNEIALVQQLYSAGATQLMLPNLPPLGAFGARFGATAVTSLNEASVAFAKALGAGLLALQQGAMNPALTIYQPDVLTQFTAVAANPASFGLGDLTTIADTIKVSPDTFLIWDGLHPTTTGHHLVAAVAANLLSPLSTSATTLTLVPAALVGQPVTISASVTSAHAGTTPTGLVTFFSGSTVAGSAALDSTGKATLTFTPAGTAGTNYDLTAVYAGDVFNLNSSSAAGSFPLLATTVATTTTVTSSATPVNPGTSVTFTATVASSVAGYGVPAGMVTFYDGLATLGTGTLTGGVATFTTSTLSAGVTHEILAVYAASGLFAGSTSPAFAETVTAPGFTAVVTPTTLTVQGGASGSLSLSATSVGGFAESLSVSCGTLPAHFSCTLNPSMLTFASGSTTSSTATLTIATNASTTASSATRAALALPGAMVLLLFSLGGRRRQGIAGVWLTAALLLLSAGAFLGLTGCGASNNAPAGTYTVPVVFTPVSTSNAVSASGPTAQTVNVTVTVQ